MLTIDLDFGKEAVQILDDGRRITAMICQEEYNDDSPRDWDNLGVMACWHSRYNLGDIQLNHHSDIKRDLACEIDPTVASRLEYWEDLEGSYRSDAEHRIQNIIDSALDSALILPLYIYDHSGITMSTSPFSCPWDSGQVGFIYCTKEQIRNWLQVKRITKKVWDHAKRILMGEVETYDQYLTGDVYGFSVTVETPDTCEHCQHTDYTPVFEDSCWGFYGDPRKSILPELNAELADHGIQLSL